MAHMRQFRFLARAFAMQPRFGIGSTLVRVIGALLPVKIHFDIAWLESPSIPGRARVRAASRSLVIAGIRHWLRLKTLRGRKAFDHRTIDTEVLAAQVGGQRLR